MPDKQFPTLSRFQENVAAFVRFKAGQFSTLKENRLLGTMPSEIGIILPLQGYSSTIAADFEDVEPGFFENIGMSLRDQNLGRFASSIFSITYGLVGLSPEKMVGGAGGKSTTAVPYSDLTFKRMVKRVHTFKFNLFPKTKADAKEIDEICKYFQWASHPQVIDPFRGVVVPPMMWNIRIVPNGGNAVSHLLDNNIQCCILSSFTANRLEVNAPVLTQDNYFAGVGIDCTFAEIETTYRKSSGSLSSTSVLQNRSSAQVGEI